MFEVGDFEGELVEEGAVDEVGVVEEFVEVVAEGVEIDGDWAAGAGLKGGVEGFDPPNDGGVGFEGGGGDAEVAEARGEVGLDFGGGLRDGSRPLDVGVPG